MPALSAPIHAIIGLGNPGKQYQITRHNAGCWLIELLAHQHHVTLRAQNKFNGLHASFHQHQRIHLFVPTTFMNLSGLAVKALCQFYQLSPENLLIAHDDLDLAPGDIRLKFGGGHAGHNGLRDIIAHLHTPNFYRLRIGIGHPRQRNLVADYVLDAPSKHDRQLIDHRITDCLPLMSDLYQGNVEKIMQILHTRCNG